MPGAVPLGAIVDSVLGPVMTPGPVKMTCDVTKEAAGAVTGSATTYVPGAVPLGAMVASVVGAVRVSVPV